MKRHSFFVRLFVGNLLLVAIIVAVTCTVSYLYLNAEYRRKDQARQQELTHLLQRHFQRAWPLSPEETDRQCHLLMEGLTARLTVIDKDGRVLGDSQADAHTMENHKTDDRPEVLAALAGRQASDVRASETLGTPYRYVAGPLRHGGEVVGVVRVAMPVEAIIEGGRFIRNALLWAGLAAGLAAVVLGLLLSLLWYAPLRQITRTARMIAAGDLSRRARVDGSAELAQLGAALNEMRDGLTHHLNLIETQRQNLSAVVANLREGVIALDSRQHIVLMNRSAIDLLAPEEESVVGRHVQSVVRVAGIVDAVEELAPGGPVRKQIEAEIQNRRAVLELHAAQLPEPAEGGISALLVIRDVTDLVRTAAMKAEFVANASHELRTPLATIRAAVDSLTALEPDDKHAFEKFLAILDRHVKRLEAMTHDLLDLHLIEQAKSALHLEDVALASLANWAEAQFGAQAKERSVTLEVRAHTPTERFRCDRTLVQLILQNLIDNGIKFTPAGGRVACDLQARNRQILLCVSDTGCGIAPEIQPRVFERFFQADTARTGRDRARGTGLGLAIVKHAAERLGGRVWLESQVGKGTTVRVVLPANPQD